MKRKSISKRRRVELFAAHGGVCCICNGRIDFKAWIVEHIKPLWLSGADDESNMAPAHLSCARIKTADEAAPRAKSDRQRAVHVGANRPKRPMLGSRASGWKRKMDGTVVRREQ